MFKTNKVLGLISIFAVYFIAAIGGLIVYLNLNLALWLNLLIADIAATAIVFIFSLIFKNASVYDPYWSVAPAVFAFGFAIYAGALSPIKIAYLIVVGVWSFRLTTNWAYTFKNLETQDWRYTMIKEKVGGVYPFVNFLGIHLFPTLVTYACSLPIVYVINSSIEFSTVQLIFAFIMLGVALCGTILEAVSDYQIHHFIATKKTGFIRTGLWKYSRHPNYLGEIITWVGIDIASLILIGKWYFIIGAVAVTLMFLIISIPMADEHQSRKFGFEEYKRETNALLPIKLKK